MHADTRKIREAGAVSAGILFLWYILASSSCLRMLAMRGIHCVVVAVLIGLAPNVLAAGEPLDLAYRYPHTSTLYVVAADGTVIEERSWSMTVLKESVLRWAKKVGVTYSTSAQSGEILHAYTLKPDGRRIDASRDSYQIEINRGAEPGKPAFSDQTSLSVVLPEVAVGDTIHFAYRVRQTEPLFPGHFAASEWFSSQKAIDNIEVRLEYPASMPIRHKARGMTLATPASDTERAGAADKTGEEARTVLVWRAANPTPLKSERTDYSVFDPDAETGVSFSTFASYGDIAAAYGARAVPKAVPNDAIRALAEEIVRGKTTPRDQARALYDWVVRNITYGGNCVGIGAVVPRDLAYVLEHRMGDCKDHATLLQALLAARGIRSTQALVNAGSLYRLPAVPVVSAVNHVINYLPDFDLFVDATSKTVPFGLLPIEDSDKPVLLVEGYRDGWKTPATPIGSRQQRMVSTLELRDNGTIGGSVEVVEKGYNAAETREMVRRMTRDEENDFVRNAYRSMGMIGSGKFEKDDPGELADSYRYRLELTLERYANFPGSGAFSIGPLFGSSLPVHRFVASAVQPDPAPEVVCGNGSSVEEYAITLPKRMKVLAIPPDLRIRDELLSYAATYRLKGRLLTVRRSIDDRTPGNVCGKEILAAYRRFGEKVVENLKAQVLYK